MCSICGHHTCTGGCPNYEPVIFDICEKCKKPIYEGKTYLNGINGYYCEECIEDMTKNEVIELLGARIETARVEDRW